VSAEIVTLHPKRLSTQPIIDAPGEPAGAVNGAREAIVEWLRGPVADDPASPEFFDASAASLIAWLWISGFKIVRVGEL
jgi:hypothetical protein